MTAYEQLWHPTRPLITLVTKFEGYTTNTALTLLALNEIYEWYIDQFRHPAHHSPLAILTVHISDFCVTFAP